MFPLKPAPGIPDRSHFGMPGRIMVQQYPASGLSNYLSIQNHNCAVGLIPLFNCKSPHFKGPGNEAALGLYIGLNDGTIPSHVIRPNIGAQ
ncbi:hypothetical protein GCM10007941_21790 [Amphritea balenae]|nr:hypothetical protein GCM10007941_21790 [Amphritea balenae]